MNNPPAQVAFHTISVAMPEIDQVSVSDWLKLVIEKEGGRPGPLNVIFCSDDYLLKMNKKHLNHSTYTDILTFDNSGDEPHIEGDIFISTERVAENAAAYEVPLTEELYRVMVHGLLHLLGYNDGDKTSRQQMQKKENLYIRQLQNRAP